MLEMGASSETIRQLEKSFQAPVYLAGSDLLTRHFWVACTAGFAYEIEPAKLKLAVQALVDQVYPILTSRLDFRAVMTGRSLTLGRLHKPAV